MIREADLIRIVSNEFHSAAACEWSMTLGSPRSLGDVLAAAAEDLGWVGGGGAVAAGAVAEAGWNEWWSEMEVDRGGWDLEAAAAAAGCLSAIIRLLLPFRPRAGSPPISPDTFGADCEPDDTRRTPSTPPVFAPSVLPVDSDSRLGPATSFFVRC
jgi:hypothetical protein